jgi:hypothetical protein
MDGLIIRPFGKRAPCLRCCWSARSRSSSGRSPRYPSLNEKAMMSGAMQLEDFALRFEALIPVLPEYPLWKKIGISTAQLDQDQRARHDVRRPVRAPRS